MVPLIPERTRNAIFWHRGDASQPWVSDEKPEVGPILTIRRMIGSTGLERAGFKTINSLT